MPLLRRLAIQIVATVGASLVLVIAVAMPISATTVYVSGKPQSVSIHTVQSDETSWLSAAQHALRQPSWQCRPYWVPVTRVTLPGLGQLHNICVTSGRTVNFVRDLPVGKGFALFGVIYDPKSGTPQSQPDSCVAHLNGPWWQFLPPFRFASAQRACPDGFQAIPGG
jgi:hypothetical protein